MPNKRKNKSKSKSASKSPPKPYGGRRHRFLKWMLTEREHGPDRAHHLGLMIAFLFAGILALLNTDRTLHKTSSGKIGPRVSQHGWPMVYLAREGPKPAELLRNEPIYDWPYPVVEGEDRRLSWFALSVDVLIASLIVIAVYWCTRRLARNTAKVKVEAASLLESS
ncbi:hypothetical protein N9Y42_05500 [Mariniblastus sp.]|nr:hypothetical protein [Mariniblastus sp.]